MATQFNNNLKPIIVNGKARLMVNYRYIPGYLIKIWSKARAADKIYHVQDTGEVLMDTYDDADILLSNEFKLVRA